MGSSLEGTLSLTIVSSLCRHQAMQMEGNEAAVAAMGGPQEKCELMGNYQHLLGGQATYLSQVKGWGRRRLSSGAG